MKQITINAPEGHVIDKFDEKTGTVSFKPTPKDIKERITCFDDVLLVNGTDKLVFEKSCEGLTKDEVAYKQLKEIIKAFNEGWIPDWNNGQWDKYYPWFDMRSSASGSISYHDYAAGIRLRVSARAFALNRQIWQNTQESYS